MQRNEYMEPCPIIWINEFISPHIVEKKLMNQNSDKPTQLLHLRVMINDKIRVISASKKELLAMAKAINKHFDNKKLGEFE